jgi:hypothetical protein
MDLEKYVTVADAARMLNRSIPMISHLCRGGRFANATKLSTGAWLIPREEVLSYKPMKRGVKPGTNTKKAKLAAERAAILEQAKGTPERDHREGT